MNSSNHLRRVSNMQVKGTLHVDSWPRWCRRGNGSPDASGRSFANKSIRSGVAVCRFRCKIIMGLVQGKTPSQLAAGGLCAASQVYRVAHLFLEEGLRGMADKREDNGEHKVDARYASELLTIVAGSPQEHGYLRPTWTQELLILVLARADGRHDQRHHDEPAPPAASGAPGPAQTDRGLSLGRSSKRPQIAADPPTRPRRGPGRSRGLRRRGGHPLEPQDRPGLDAPGSTEGGPHPGAEPEALPGRGLGRADGETHLGRGAAQDQPAVPGIALSVGDPDLPDRPPDSCDPRQLRDPRQPPGAPGVGDGEGAAIEVPLPAALLPRSQSHRTRLGGPARERHTEPPLPDHGATHGTSEDLPRCPEQARAPLLPSS